MIARALPLTGAVTAQDIAAFLREHGVEVVKVEDSTLRDIEDDSIDLGGGVHVQVGTGYASVNAWVDNGTAIVFGEERHNAADLLADVVERRKVASAAPAEERPGDAVVLYGKDGAVLYGTTDEAPNGWLTEHRLAGHLRTIGKLECWIGEQPCPEDPDEVDRNGIGYPYLWQISTSDGEHVVTKGADSLEDAARACETYAAEWNARQASTEAEPLP